jgi:hypothetical protein
MPRSPVRPFQLDHHERSHSAKCRAITLRQVAAALADAGAKARLEAHAKNWDAEAEEAERLADGEDAKDFRHRRLDGAALER